MYYVPKMLTIPFVYLAKIMALILVPLAVSDVMAQAKMTPIQCICGGIAVALWIAVVNLVLNKYYINWLEK